MFALVLCMRASGATGSMQPHEYLARYSRVCVVPVAREGALAKNKSKHARTNNKQLLAPARAHMQG
jgi:hypothetical protein